MPDPSPPAAPSPPDIVARPHRRGPKFLPLLAAFALLALAAAAGLTLGHAAFVARQPRPSHWLAPGPWGRLRATRLRIQPPVRRWHPDFDPQHHDRWIFADTSPRKMSQLLANLHLAPPRFKRLVADTRSDAAVAGFVITPAPAVVRHLSGPVHARLYDRLSTNSMNLPQVNAFRYWGRSVRRWLAHAHLTAATRRRIRQLTYRNGHLLFFADLPLVLHHIPAGQQRPLERALCRQATVRLTLCIHHHQNLAPLIRYWGRGGRDKIIAAKLKPLARAAAGGRINIAQLLPPFARRHLDRYPTATAALPPGQSRDCHWSALNFFNRRANPQFAKKSVVTAALHHDYHPVAQPRFGDLVEFVSHGIIFHSAVYIAGNILFTKNGARTTQPWMLLPLRVMKDFYPSQTPMHVVVLRRNQPPTPRPAAQPPPARS